MSNNTGNTIIALIVGATVGVGIGILFAPDKGSKTRGKIKDGYDEAKDNLLHKLEDVSSEFKNKFSKAKFNLEENYEDLISTLSNKKEDAISFLETKLADLKNQKSKLQN